jgi:hypothetical protein
MSKLDNDSKKIDHFDKQIYEKNIKSIAILELYSSINGDNKSIKIIDFIRELKQILEIH